MSNTSSEKIKNLTAEEEFESNGEKEESDLGSEEEEEDTLSKLWSYEKNEARLLRRSSRGKVLRRIGNCHGLFRNLLKMDATQISPQVCVASGSLENILQVLTGRSKIKAKLLEYLNDSNLAPFVKVTNATVKEADQFTKTLFGLDFLNSNNYKLFSGGLNVASSILHRPSPLSKRDTSPFKSHFLSSRTELDCGTLALASKLSDFQTTGIIIAKNNRLLPGVIYAHPLEKMQSVIMLNRKDLGEWELFLSSAKNTFEFKLKNGKILFPSAILANWIESQFEQKELLRVTLKLTQLVPGFETGSWLSASAAIPRAASVFKNQLKKNRINFYSSKVKVGNLMIQDAMWAGPTFELTQDLINAALPIAPISQKDYALLDSTYWPVYFISLQTILLQVGINISTDTDPTFVKSETDGTPFIDHIMESMYLFVYPKYPALFDLTATFLLKTYRSGESDAERELPVLKTIWARLVTKNNLVRLDSTVFSARDFIATFDRITPEFNSYRLSHLSTTHYACLSTTTNFELTAKIMMLFLIQVVRPFMNWTQTYYLTDLYIPWLIPESLFQEKYKFLGNGKQCNQYRQPQFLDSIFSKKPTQAQLKSPIWILPITIRQSRKYFQRILLVFHNKQDESGWIEFFDTCNSSAVRRYVIAALQTAAVHQHKDYAAYGYRITDYKFYPMIRPDSYLTNNDCYLRGNAAQKNKDCLLQNYLFAILSMQNENPEKLIAYVNYSPVAYSKTAYQVERELFSYAFQFLKIYKDKMTTFVLTHFKHALVSLAKQIHLRKVPDAQLLQYLNSGHIGGE
jgi:hypothetical protein